MTELLKAEDVNTHVCAKSSRIRAQFRLLSAKLVKKRPYFHVVDANWHRFKKFTCFYSTLAHFFAQSFNWRILTEFWLFFIIYIVVHIKFITANWINIFSKDLFCRHVRMLSCLRKHNEVNLVRIFNFNFSTLSLKHPYVFLFMLGETFSFLFSIFTCIVFFYIANE